MFRTSSRLQRAAGGLLLLGLLAGCGESITSVVADPLTISVNVEAKATDVPVDTLVRVDGENGRLESVSLTSDDEKFPEVPGELVDDTWTATERLEPNAAYTLKVSGEGDNGQKLTHERTFTTQTLTRHDQIFASVAPLNGETVGVGMPVIVYFDLRVTDRAAFEQQMHVTAEPAVEGSWYWLSDTEAHWRPQEYWAAGTKVHVDLDLNSIPAGNGRYGQVDKVVDFSIGRSVVSTVDVASHTMTVRIDGAVARTIPVTTGDDSHRTRRGTKIIMEKFSSKRMDAATTGVDSMDPDYYNIDDVRWAMRLTGTGEFIHAAPWSAGSHGRANVSHGCTGMGMDNAAWLYSVSRRGDVVEYVNSSRTLEPGNGWTDWNVPWTSWLAGSALAGQATSTPSPTP